MKKNLLSTLGNKRKRYLPVFVSGCMIAAGISSCNATPVDEKSVAAQNTVSDVDLQQSINTAEDNTSPSSVAPSSVAPSSTKITEDKAKEIALAKSGGGTVLTCHLDYEDGREIYDIEVLNHDMKYQMDIAVTDGAIYDYEETLVTKPSITPPASTTEQSTQQKSQPAPSTGTATISAEQAKEIALKKTGAGTVLKCEQDYENGVLVYEIEIVDGRLEYNMDINATTGAITNYEQEDNN